MTDREYEEYLNGEPTIRGIITEMKSWWSNEGSDKIIQKSFDKILELLSREMFDRTTTEMAYNLDDPNISKLNSLPLVVGYLLDCPKCGTTFVYHSDLKEVCPKCGEQIQQQYLE